MKNKFNVIFILSILISFPCFSDTASDLGDYFDAMGYDSQINSPTAYNNQSAYYFSAGSVSLKNKVSNIQPLSITLPSISAGCGGIDLIAGGLSFLDSDKLVEFAKNVASNAEGLAFDLGVQTLTPQLHSVLSKLQSWAQKLNQMNLNSCSTARAGISAIQSLTSTNDANKSQCIELLMSESSYTWSDATEACNSNATSILEQFSTSNSTYKDRIVINKNIMWDELMKQDMFTEDTDLAEMIMSVSGTIIYDDSGNKQTYPSKLSSKSELISALLRGGTYTVWTCDDTDDCLNPSSEEKTLAESDSLNSKVLEKVEYIVTQLENDQALNDSSKQFLEMTSLPIMRLMASLIESGESLEFYEIGYSEVIATEILEKYLSNVTQITADVLSGSIVNPDDIAVLQNNVRTAQQFVNGMSLDSLTMLTKKYELIQQRKEAEKQIQAQMSNYILNY